MSQTTLPFATKGEQLFDHQQSIVHKAFSFCLKRYPFDENYCPTDNTRLTTNFANLARGECRQENLKNALRMINNRFNTLAHWDNLERNRYRVELEIISVEMIIDAQCNNDAFPLIEILKTTIIDQKTGKPIEGIVGNNFSSYIRDYDFSIVLPAHNKDRSTFIIPVDFGDLHGKLFKYFLNSNIYKEHFHKLPVICLSASTSKLYNRTSNVHPILGVEYQQSELSLTDQYFQKMGLQVRFFMPANSVAPFAFYFIGDLLNDYTNLELVSMISTMETFQKIYRPEIYNANSPAGIHYNPSLEHQDYSQTQIVYDREERSKLAVEQGKFAEEHFIKPYQAVIEQWLSNNSL